MQDPSGELSEAAQPSPLWNVLPFDILYIIFDSVAQSFSFPAIKYSRWTARNGYTTNEADLKECFLTFSLVCRYWHTAAQPYLHKVLSLQFEASPTADPGTNHKGLLDILQWLDTQPLLPAAVRQLRLTMVQNPRKPGLSGCDPSLLHTLLRRFHHVRTVELYDPIFDSMQLAAHASALAVACAEEREAAAPIDLDTLMLTYGPRGQTALLCFAWFGSVSKLVICSNAHSRRNVPDTLDAALDCLPARLAARALVLESAVSAEVRECLHRSPTFGHEGTLHALHVRLSSLSEATLGAYLRPAPRELEELHLDLTPWHLRSAEVTVAFGELPRLRELKVLFWLKDPSGIAGWDVVHAILNTLLLRPQCHNVDDREHGLPPLRRVILVLHGGLSDVEHFARVSAVLAGVPTLERCTLDCQTVFDDLGTVDRRKAWFRKHMSELHARGALRFGT